MWMKSAIADVIVIEYFCGMLTEKIKILTCSLVISSVLMPSTIVALLGFADFFLFFFLPLFFFGGYQDKSNQLRTSGVFDIYI